MTDKVQKIREGVERLKSQLLRGACSSQIAMETMCKEEAYNEVLSIIDSMQEKPKECMYSKDNYTKEDRKVLCDGCKEDCKFNKKEEPVSNVWHYQKKEPINGIADKSRPIIVVYGNNSLNAAGKFRYYEDNSDAIWLSNSYEKWAFVEDLINLAHSVTKVSWQEEPISEDLETFTQKESEAFAEREYEIDYIDRNALGKGYYWGCIDGAKWQKEQMVAKAVDGGCFSYKNGFVHISCDIDEHLTDIKMGDKVKVIVIKED